MKNTTFPTQVSGIHVFHPWDVWRLASPKLWSCPELVSLAHFYIYILVLWKERDKASGQVMSIVLPLALNLVLWSHRSSREIRLVLCMHACVQMHMGITMWPWAHLKLGFNYETEEESTRQIRTPYYMNIGFPKVYQKSNFLPTRLRRDCVI